MRVLSDLLQKNRDWARVQTDADPEYFERLARQQAPQYLWIGCSDSRVPANQIVDLAPGELFVHRNVGNLVVPTDFNCLSVVEYAVEVLRVKHIMVVGHYGCGGVGGALEHDGLGLISNWLRHVKDIRDLHSGSLECLPDEAARADRLCELNVIEQVRHLAHTSLVTQAWKRGQSLSIHGWIYDVGDGLVRDLDVCTTGMAERDRIYRQGLESLLARPPKTFT